MPRGLKTTFDGIPNLRLAEIEEKIGGSVASIDITGATSLIVLRWIIFE